MTLQRFSLISSVLVIVILCGCRRNAYPGYIEALRASEITYFIDPASLSRSDKLLQFEVLKEHKDRSYAVQLANTDCATQLTFASGRQFARDGRQVSWIPSSESRFGADTDLSQLAYKACDLYGQTFSFEGEFQPEKAMQVLFGNYNFQNHRSVWKAESALSRTGGLKYEQGQTVYASPMWVGTASEDGAQQKYLVITESEKDDDDCMFYCDIGAFVFWQSEGRWKLRSGSKLIYNLEDYPVKDYGSTSQPDISHLRCWPHAEGHQGDCP